MGKGGKRMSLGRMEGREVEGGMGKGVEGETGKHGKGRKGRNY